jgi:YgiT-type zinc finger domain-containing protein
MGDAKQEETVMNPCTIAGCTGQYEDRKITHTVTHRGSIVVIGEVPAHACSVCGDTVFSIDTARQMDAFLAQRPPATESVPLYHFKKAG